MEIVDPHHHLWDLTHYDYAWLKRQPPDAGPEGDITPIAHDYLLPDYLADTSTFRLAKSVHLQCGWDELDPVGETRWLQSIADAHGFPQGIVGCAKLNDDGVEQILAGHRESANVRGIRQIVNWHRDPIKNYVPWPKIMADEQWLRGFRLLRKYDLRFDLQLYPSQMAAAAELAAAHPDQPIILNHTGMPTDRDAEGLATWRRGMELLAQCPNVAVKISGLGMCDRSWTVDSWRPFVLDTIELFGADRSMFASNFPVDKLYGSFEQTYNAFDAITASFTEAERTQMFCTNAQRIYAI